MRWALLALVAVGCATSKEQMEYQAKVDRFIKACAAAEVSQTPEAMRQRALCAEWRMRRQIAAEDAAWSAQQATALANDALAVQLYLQSIQTPPPAPKDITCVDFGTGVIRCH